MTVKIVISILKNFQLRYKWESTFLEDDLVKCNTIPESGHILWPQNPIWGIYPKAIIMNIFEDLIARMFIMVRGLIFSILKSNFHWDIIYLWWHAQILSTVKYSSISFNRSTCLQDIECFITPEHPLVPFPTQTSPATTVLISITIV